MVFYNRPSCTLQRAAFISHRMDRMLPVCPPFRLIRLTPSNSVLLLFLFFKRLSVSLWFQLLEQKMQADACNLGIFHNHRHLRRQWRWLKCTGSFCQSHWSESWCATCTVTPTSRNFFRGKERTFPGQETYLEINTPAWRARLPLLKLQFCT